MDQHSIILGAWIATGTAGLVFGLAAVAVVKRRLRRMPAPTVTTRKQPLPA